jgi:hypothetical protein
MSWQPAPDGMITTHFSWSEAACRHCERIPDETTVRETAEWLERVRTALSDRILHVNGWCRCDEHGRNISGTENGLHAQGVAVDLTVRGLSPREAYILLQEHQGEGRLVGGLSYNPGFVHVDRGPARLSGLPESD